LDPQDDWVEIRIPAGEVDPTELAGMLAGGAGAAAAGVELRGTTVVFWVRAPDADRALGETHAAIERLAAAGVPVRAAAVEVAAASPESVWREAWKRHFGVAHVSAHLVVVPSWERYDPADGEVILDLDPGGAFGTGAHASTRLCLIELDALSNSAEPAIAVHRFLDCGTGSGILAIAAAKLWPECRGVAIDIDPAAVDVATENLRHNQVDGRVQCIAGSADAADGVFDLVVANIERIPLLALRDTLVGRLAPGGVLVLSGITADEVAEVVEAYVAGRRLRVLRTRDLEDDLRWSVVVLAATRV
jgi:ribosomal protein L11 methyltransferase